MSEKKQKRKVEYKCQSCGHVFSVDYTSWKPVIECEKCLGKAQMTALMSDASSKPFFKKYRDVTGFGFDEHGKYVAIDTKGRRVAPEETRYKPDDEHGWQATGHKVKGKQKR